jgi:CubicO group peptidase (beta-lactamase class C family)
MSRVVAAAIAAALTWASRPVQAQTTQIDSIFSRFANRESPGCGVGVSRNGTVVLEKAYGMANLEDGVPIGPTSIFHVASISKQFTAMSIMLLDTQGKLSLDDDVRKYIPELPDYGSRITVRNLLSHTSGIRDQWSLLRIAGWREDDLITEADVLRIVTRQRALNFEPGTEYLYSNSGFTLLAIIVKRVSGQTLRDFADANIFKPLGMTRTHFHDDHTMVVKNRTSAYQPRRDSEVAKNGPWRVSIPVFDTYGATSLFTTVGDLLRWEQNFTDGRVGGMPVLARMQQPFVLANGDTTGYGLGLAVSRRRGVRQIGHGGADAGYRADVERYPDQGLAVAVLCNASNSNPADLAARVADVYLGSSVAPVVATQAGGMRLASDVLVKYAGVYRNAASDAFLRIEVRDGNLRVAGQMADLRALSEARFAFPNGPGEVTFTGNALRLSAPGGRDQVYQREAPFAPSREQLRGYEGSYYGDEVEALLKVSGADSGIVLHTTRLGDAVGRPVFVDAFSTDQGLVRFTRGPAGDVTGLTLSTGRVRRLAFVRR